MKSAFDNNAHEAAPSAQKTIPNTEKTDTILDDVMEVFSMVMHKGYKHEPTALSYWLNDDDGVTIRFRHSSAFDVEDHDEAIKQHEPFFRDMHHFLSELDGLDTQLDVYPGVLTLHAENMVAVIDALSVYFRQENCTLRISDTAKPDMAERAALAHYGASMIDENKEAYEYYLDSIPSQGFTSIDHLNATIAARALCDIPVSLEMMRRQAVGTPSVLAQPLSAAEHRIMLEDSFNGCAAWCDEPLSIPSESKSSFLLEKERHMQLASTIQSLLMSHYHLAREINRGYVHTSIGQVDGPTFDMRFGCRTMPQGKVFGDYYAKFHQFAEDFRKAGAEISGVMLMPVEDKRLLTIRYFPEDLFKVLVNMVAEQHPGDLIAQAHLRAAAQITERIGLKLPVNALN